MASRAVLEVTEEARSRVMELACRSPEPAEQAMWLSVTGVRDGEYDFELTLKPRSAARAGDVVERHGDLTVVVAEGSIERVLGATVGWADGAAPGLVLHNPNKPPAPVELPMSGGGPPASPAVDPRRAGDLEGTVAERVTQILERVVNPAIASHGGRAELVGVDGAVAALRLGGGCQGCAVAEVTLTEGIEQSIIQAVPEIERVVDVTDHAAGANPYYEASPA